MSTRLPADGLFALVRQQQQPQAFGGENQDLEESLTGSIVRTCALALKVNFPLFHYLSEIISFFFLQIF
jgi:hypothetical protein